MAADAILVIHHLPNSLFVTQSNLTQAQAGRGSAGLWRFRSYLIVPGIISQLRCYCDLAAGICQGLRRRELDSVSAKCDQRTGYGIAVCAIDLKHQWLR